MLPAYRRNSWFAPIGQLNSLFSLGCNDDPTISHPAFCKRSLPCLSVQNNRLWNSDQGPMLKCDNGSEGQIGVVLMLVLCEVSILVFSSDRGS